MPTATEVGSPRFPIAAVHHPDCFPEDRPSILGTLVRSQVVDSQQVLFHEGDHAASVLEVMQGVVRLCRLLADGRRSITGFAFAGSVLGLSFRDVYVYTSQAITQCEIRRSGQAAVARLLDIRAEFRHQLFNLVSDELCSAQEPSSFKL